MHSYFYVFQWKVTGMPVKLGPNVLNLLIRKYTQKIPWSAFTNFVSETDGYTYSRASPFERILFLFFFFKKIEEKKKKDGAPKQDAGEDDQLVFVFIRPNINTL